MWWIPLSFISTNWYYLNSSAISWIKFHIEGWSVDELSQLVPFLLQRTTVVEIHAFLSLIFSPFNVDLEWHEKLWSAWLLNIWYWTPSFSMHSMLSWFLFHVQSPFCYTVVPLSRKFGRRLGVVISTVHYAMLFITPLGTLPAVLTSARRMHVRLLGSGNIASIGNFTSARNSLLNTKLIHINSK